MGTVATMPEPIALSPSFIASASAEREQLIEKWRECRERYESSIALAEEAAKDAERYARTIRELGEILGMEDQLSIVNLSDEIRGERLREVATDVLWRHHRVGDVVHYKEWLELVVREGHRVGGKSPTATFLTQVARVDSVERVGKRSGLYRLVAAA
jgi:hypothetical protein